MVKPHIPFGAINIDVGRGPSRDKKKKKRDY